MSDADLFGRVEPATVSKNREGYLTHLAGLTYPTGLQFWCLSAEPRGKTLRRFDVATTEMVCFRSQFYWVHALVDIATGRVLAQVKREPLSRRHQRRKHDRKVTRPEG